MYMVKKLCVVLLVGVSMPVCAQRLLTLDSCRAMALRNNKQMGVAKVKQDIAENLRKSARTKYLPHVSAIGTYQYTSREISLLNDQQKSVLPHIGDAMVGGLESDLTKIVGGLPMENINLVLSSMGLKLEDLQNLGHAEMEKFSGQLNGIGQSLVDALETDTRHLFAGSIMVVQPVFLGGSIIALNKMADINEEMQDNSAEARRQTTLYNTDKVYWQVVSLKHKQRLAQSYLDLVQKLSSDVNKMLEGGVKLSKQVTNILKAGNLPMVGLTGGYAVTNPSLFNGFQRKFQGFWNVGVLVRVPIWNWGDVMYKVRASKGATTIANLELQEAREKIELQVNQNTFRVNEANKKLTMAQSNIARADENLRTANLGFQEGVISPTTVMEAQTAWLQAQSQKIDAEIDVRLSQVDLQKSLGILE